MEPYYYYNGQLRWTFVFANPNHAGVFLGCIVPYVWYFAEFARSKLLRLALIAMELVILYGVARTYSRGAFVAVIVGAAYYATTRLRGDSLEPKEGPPSPIARAITFTAIRVGALVVLAVHLDFVGRMAIPSMMNDASVLNRVDLWKAALQTIYLHPIEGAGWNRAGDFTAQWLMPITNPHDYISIVSGFLEFPSEIGLFLFIAICGVLFTCIAAPFVCRPTYSIQAVFGQRVAGAVLCVFIAANLFSTLYTPPGLVIVPALTLAVALLLVLKGERPQICRLLRLAFVSSAFLAINLYIVGWVFFEASQSEVVYQSDGEAYRATLRGVPREGNALVMLDDNVLGRTYGKHLRGWMPSGANEMLIIDPAAAPNRMPELISEASIVVAFGRTVDLLRGLSPEEAKIVVLVNPQSHSPTHIGRFSHLILAEFDETGQKVFWETLAKECGSSIQVVPEMGQNLQSVDIAKLLIALAN